MRVVIMKDYMKEHFPQTDLLDYALDVEKITTAKVRSLSFRLKLTQLPIGYSRLNLYIPALSHGH